jgi:hypothetical protein
LAFPVTETMPRSGWRRPLAVLPLSLGLLALVACAGAGAGDRSRPGATSGGAAESGGPQRSTSPRVGEALSESNADQEALSAHLRARGAVFYGAWWCPACFQQKSLFGRQAGNNLPYVECTDEPAGRERCEAAGIRAFPTWEMEGKPRLEGVQTLEELKAWSDFRGGSDTAAQP